MEEKTKRADIEVCQLNNIHLETFENLVEKYSEDEKVIYVQQIVALNHKKIL